MTTHLLPALFGAVIGVALAGYGGYSTRNALRERSAVKSAPDATAGTLRAGQGPVELDGTAHAAEYSFTSPLTQQECIAYRFVKEEKQRKHTHQDNDLHLGDDDDHHDNRPKYEWVTIHEEESGAPFWVDDGTGRTLVDGSTADLDMERSYEVDTDDVKQGIGEKVVASVKGLVGGDSPEEEHEIPEQYVEELRDGGAHGRRYKEWVVHEGEEVYVYGEAVAPEQTPLGSGVESEMSAAVGAVQSGGGLLGMLTGLVGVGKEAASNPQTRYKPRAIKRLPDPDTEAQDQHRQEVQETAEEVKQMNDQDLQNNPQAARDMMDKATEMMQQAGAAASDTLPPTPALDDAPAVVSWGDQAPTFVVSDQGKGSVLRDYSTGAAKYAVLAIVGIALAVGAVAFGLGLF